MPLALKAGWARMTRTWEKPLLAHVWINYYRPCAACRLRRLSALPLQEAGECHLVSTLRTTESAMWQGSPLHFASFLTQRSRRSHGTDRSKLISESQDYNKDSINSSISFNALRSQLMSLLRCNGPSYNQVLGDSFSHCHHYDSLSHFQ